MVTGAYRLTVVQNSSDLTGREKCLVNGYVQTQLEDTSYALISLNLLCIKSRIMNFIFMVPCIVTLY